MNEGPDKSIETTTTIGTADSFDALYEILQRAGGLQGSRKMYTFDELREEIESLRVLMPKADTTLTDKRCEFFLNNVLDKITEQSGLRQKVKELLMKERRERMVKNPS